MDGTLIGRDLRVRPRVRAAIANAREQGVAGCLVTGRMFRAALPYARELSLDAPIICYQGAAICDPNTDEVWRHTPLPNATVLAVAHFAKANGLHVQLYADDKYYVEKENRFSDLYAQLALIRPIVVDSLEETFRFSAATKAVIIDDAERIAQYAPRVEEAFRGQAYVTRSYPQFLEVLHPNVDKGEALRFVAGRLGFDMSAVVAIGDSWNDAPLLRAAGFGIAMDSAPHELHAVAQAIVPDVSHDGVAEAIERYVLR